MTRDGVSREPSDRKERNILCVGRAHELLELRAMVLRAAGFRVDEERDLTRAVEGALDDSINLVLLCHTLNPLEQSRIIDALRVTRQHLPIASVITLDHCGAPSGSVPVPSDPQRLIDAIRRIFHEDGFNN
jgi:hypothetical protein